MQSNFEPSRSLMDFHVAGFAHHDGLRVIEDLKLGTKVDLRFEPDNPHDTHAVAIYYEDVKIGYIPTVKNALFFTMLYYGHEIFEARISMVNTEVHPERQFRVSVKILDGR